MFRATCGIDAARASVELGLRLSLTKVEAVRRIPARAIDELASCVDDSIRQLRPRRRGGA